LAEQPDLNWRHPELRAQMMNVLQFWLERGVAGFRVDVLDRIFKDPLLRDDPPNPFYQEGQPDFMRLRSVNSSNQPELMDVIADMRELLARYGSDRVLIGELYQPIHELIAFYGTPKTGVHIPFNFNLMWQAWQPQAIAALITDFEKILPHHAWPNWVLSNHDQSRIATRFGVAQAKTAMMLMLTLRGTPILYQGDELGLQDVPVPRHLQQDPFARVGEGGRDAYRSPMPWANALYGGFSARHPPWLPLPPDLAHINAQDQGKDPLSLLSLTRTLIALRRREPLLTQGQWHLIDATATLLIYERRDDRKRIRIILNFSDQAQRCGHGHRHGHIILSTHYVTPRPAAQEIELAPNEGVIIACP
jgi:alpha-glucosidase